MTGKLYVVGTPIGNLQDITLRAIATLKSVDIIAAEDTRHTGKLLQYFQISTPQISYHQHNCYERLPQLLSLLTGGKKVALVADAGMPTIADAGVELIRACIAENIPIIPIPGVTALITALVGSGMDTQQFVFLGFWRQEYTAQLEREHRTVICYEAPHRLLQTLQQFHRILAPERQITIARELTKLHETWWRGTVREAIEHFSQYPPKGEITIVIAGQPTPPEQWSEPALMAELQALIQSGMSKSSASKHLAELTHLSRRYLYQLSLQIEV